MYTILFITHLTTRPICYAGWSNDQQEWKFGQTRGRDDNQVTKRVNSLNIIFEEEVAAAAAYLLINTHNGCLLGTACYSQHREAMRYHITVLIKVNYAAFFSFLHFVSVLINN